MRLQRIELLGFKSFADRTEFAFEPGITGIVGPNGCGKSNVVEAIRWVLGEQRPGALRGEEMADVIFKGSASRTAFGFAEVGLVFEGNGEAASDERAEIAIRRRLFRTGESEYLLHDRPCRLKDVRDFLFDHQMGALAHTILEQGRVDAVLSSDPLERRALFEDASGIAKFRARRKEALRRLEQVDQEGVRLGDLLGELERQARGLRVQAGRAKRFEELRAALRERRIALALHRRAKGEAEGEEARRVLDRLEAQAARAREAREAREAEVRDREARAAALEEEAQRLARDSAEVSTQERLLSERAEAARRRAEELDRAAEGQEARAEGAREEVGTIERERAEVDREREGPLERLQEAEAKSRSAREGAEAALGDYRDKLRALGAGNEALLAAAERRTRARNRLAEVDGALRAAAARGAAAARRLEEARARGAALREERARGEAAADAARSAALAEEEAAKREGGAVEERAALLERGQARLQEAESALAGLRSTLEVLDAVGAEGKGLEAGGQTLVDSASPGIEGWLAARIRGGAGLAHAVEAALGPFVEGVLARSVEDAAAAVRWLRETRQGRALLATADLALPLRRRPAPPEDPRLQGRLLDALEVDEASVSVLEDAIGDVFLVADEGAALALSKARPDLRFVTREGALFGRGAIVGGLPQGGPIARRHRREALEGEEGIVARRVLEERAAVEAARSALEESRSEAAQAAARAVRASTLAGETETRLESLREREREAARALESAGLEVAAVEDEAAGPRAEREEAERAVLEAEEIFEGLAEASRDLEEARRSIEARRAEAAGAEEGALRSLAEARGRLASLDERLSSLAARIAASRAEADRYDAAAKESREAGARSRSEAEAHLSSAREAARAREAAVARVAEAETASQRVREECRAARTEIGSSTKSLEGLQSAIAEARLRVQRFDLEREERLRRLREDYGVNLEELASSFAPDPAFDEGACDAEVAGLRGRIEKFGPVNLEALAELDPVEERLRSLGSQRADLEASRRSLREAIQRMDEESRARFEETFRAVRENFQTVFRQLFRGGKADVFLEEGVDPLEAGVEIVARPPGKELRSIELLSGGERSLAAIALLFAIFRARPSPFCVLDEVDAALDDANVERFLGLLRECTRETQFVVVTHNRRTMAACDLLFGVTMEESGVSKRVAVKMGDIDEQRRLEEVAAAAPPPAGGPEEASLREGAAVG